MRKKSTYLLLCFLLGTGTVLIGQNAPLDASLRYMQENAEQLGLTHTDIQDYVVTDQYQSNHNGATHIYMRQRYQGIEVYNAIFNLTLDNKNKVAFVGNRYVSDLKNKVNGSSPSLTPIDAVKAAAQHLNIPLTQDLEVIKTIDQRQVTIGKGGISLHVIPVKLMFQPMLDGTVKLAWDLSIYTIDAQNYWSVRIDALTGALLNKDNLVVHCQHNHGKYANPDRAARKSAGVLSPFHNCQEDHLDKVNQVGSYNVFAMPLESPLHGSRSLTVDPEDPIASPYGWHDTDGQAGAEYTITRGNNVHAYSDTANLNFSSGNEPDGGPSLVFDFPLDLTLEPEQSRDAAVTNLFYWNNIIHDVWYQYGFDEAGGNFQFNTYGRGGFGGDPVQAQENDGSGSNNANFLTPPDGGSGIMQMYLWTNDSGDILTVNTGGSSRWI